MIPKEAEDFYMQVYSKTLAEADDDYLLSVKVDIAIKAATQAVKAVYGDKADDS